MSSLFAVLEQTAQSLCQRPHHKGEGVTDHRGIILLKVLHFIILLYIIDDTLIYESEDLKNDRTGEEAPRKKADDP